MKVRALAVTVLMLVVCSSAFALAPQDPPHGPFFDNCIRCHPPQGQADGTTTCLWCHDLDPLFPNFNAPFVTTHSSAATGTAAFEYTLDCTSCHHPHDQEQDRTFGTTYGKYIRRTIDQDIEVTDFTVSPANTFTKSVFGLIEFTNPFQFVDGDSDYTEDICSTCHTLTNHHQNDGMAPGGQAHNDGTNCTVCHAHQVGFAPDFSMVTAPPPHDMFDCAVCHDVDAGGNVLDGFPGAPIPNAKCDTCHGLGSPGAAGGGSDLDVVEHYSDTYVDPTTGFLTSIACVECHDPMSVQVNFRGNTNLAFVRETIRGTPVAFESPTGPYSFAYDLADQPMDMLSENYLCNTCHTQTNHHQSDGMAPGGQVHFDGANCTECHSHQDGFTAVFTPAPPPHDGFDCSVCHLVDGAGNILDAFPGAPIANAKCDACHGPGSPDTLGGGSDLDVVEHFSDTYVDPTTGLPTSIDCVECHNPMSVQLNFRGNTNLAFIRGMMRGAPVAFEDTVGPYSFAYDLADQPADMLAENYLCNTCHTQTNHHQTGGFAPGGQQHFDGQDCTQCHSHEGGFQGFGGAHPEAQTDCSNCHVDRQTGQPDIQGLHGGDCSLCHASGFDPPSFTILGPLGVWDGECSACHNPFVFETGSLATPTKGHRCISCHGQQMSTADVQGFHEGHTREANCVVCHGFVPDTGVAIGSGNRDSCHLCHGTRYDGSSMREFHRSMVPEGTSCIECHHDGRPPVDVFPGDPVGSSTNVCRICHSDEDPDEFRNDSEDLHKKHSDERLDCGACHLDANLQDDREPMPPVSDFRRFLVDRAGFNECTFCHENGRNATARRTHDKHVGKQWQWCYNCHEDFDERPLGTVPPVTQPSESCSLCHRNRSYEDTFPFDIHYRHADAVKCYACHQTLPPLFDWPDAWMTSGN